VLARVGGQVLYFISVVRAADKRTTRLSLAGAYVSLDAVAGTAGT
jgi:hypothetical protein